MLEPDKPLEHELDEIRLPEPGSIQSRSRSGSSLQLSSPLMNLLLSLTLPLADTVRDCQGQVDYEYKEDYSLFTKVDGALDRYFNSRLPGLLPGSIVVSEESCKAERSTVDAVFAAPYVWAVDPIDGTSNYAFGLPLYGVSVGLLENRGGALFPVDGLVLLPALNEVWCTDGDQALILDLNDGGRRELTPRTAPVAADERYLAPEGSAYTLERRSEPPLSVMTLACSSIEVLFTAAGRAVGTLTGGALWDVAAAMALGQRTNLALLNVDTLESKWDPRDPQSGLMRADLILRENSNLSPSADWCFWDDFIVGTPSNAQLLHKRLKYGR